jgi:hypothetical protein
LLIQSERGFHLLSHLQKQLILCAIRRRGLHSYTKYSKVY